MEAGSERSDHDEQPGSAKAASARRAQRERILRAAKHCFVEHGFHAASMADIAKTAEMSAGLIYRYFESKGAIVLAIVDRQMELLRNDIQLNRQVDLPTEMAHNYGRAARVPRHERRAVAGNVGRGDPRSADRRRARPLRHDAARGPAGMAVPRPRSRRAWLPAAVVPARALILQCLVEGLKVRETREPGLDRALLTEALQEFVPLLLKP